MDGTLCKPPAATTGTSDVGTLREQARLIFGAAGAPSWSPFADFCPPDPAYRYQQIIDDLAKVLDCEPEELQAALRYAVERRSHDE
jgi:hypothetical protein